MRGGGGGGGAEIACARECRKPHDTRTCTASPPALPHCCNVYFLLQELLYPFLSTTTNDHSRADLFELFNSKCAIVIRAQATHASRLQITVAVGSALNTNNTDKQTLPQRLGRGMILSTWPLHWTPASQHVVC